MEAPDVVFVRGTGRCGSKTLVNLLATHPALARMPNQCLPEELIDWSRHHVPKRTPAATSEALGAGCRAFFEAYGRAIAGRPGALLHKSTANAHHLGTLLELWPDARIVYIVRHPLGVVPALVACDVFQFKGMYGYDANVENSLLRWSNDVLAYLRSSAFGHPRVLQVQFEKMVADPVPFFDRLHSWLEIEAHAVPALPGPMDYDERFVLSQRDRQWIIESTREIVTALGYEADAWSADVPESERARVHDFEDRRLSEAPPPCVDGVELVGRAIDDAVARGFSRIGLFGAGYLSRLVCPWLKQSGRSIVALFDEDPTLVGSDVSGIPIMRPEGARARGVDAVIPVTMVHQERMMAKWHHATGGDPPILPLFSTRAECAAASESDAHPLAL